MGQIWNMAKASTVPSPERLLKRANNRFLKGKIHYTFIHVHVQFPRPLPLARTSYWREQRERQKLVQYKTNV